MRLLIIGLFWCAVGACKAGATAEAATQTPIENPQGVVMTHPGSIEKKTALVEALGQALSAKGKDYKPRTKHLREDGSPKYINRLIQSTSPYLLQHAHNPVDWRPWGEEALAEAQRLNRPLLISVGYSTCHWCHVMEEESFESEAIAELINQLYVPIKVDREERPDIDSLYMAAVHKLRRSGGWPMTVWADPEGLPFFAGTYFPPDGQRGVVRGFQSLLKTLAKRWETEPEAVRVEAQRLAEEVARSLKPAPSGPELSLSAVEITVRWAMGRFDSTWGGMRGRPKFPSSMPLHLLFRFARRNGDQSVLDAATLTLEKMQDGGIHDQLGGGFHRYSTDERWLVPHFEKMLYDNALLAHDFLTGYQMTGREDFAQTVRFTLDYVLREMTRSDGAFYSATDADSEGEEGTFFLWDLKQLDELLPKAVARSVIAAWDVTKVGNFEGRNILWVPRALNDVAKDLKLTRAELDAHLSHAREVLYPVRAKRIAPGLDDKIMVDWNGLMIAAFARAGWVLNAPQYIQAARRAADFHLKTMRGPKGRLRHSTKDGARQEQAFLDDYAFLIHGLIELAQADGDPKWLSAARSLQDLQDRHYGDAEHGAWYLTSDDQRVHIAREKPDYDGAIPSGNSVSLHNLIRLSTLTGDPGFDASARRAFRGLSQAITRGGMDHALAALERADDRPLEVVIVHPDGGATSDLFSVLRTQYLPNATVFELSESQAKELSVEVPWLGGKTALEGKSTAFVCERGVCQLPAFTIAKLLAQIPEPVALR